MPAASRVGDPVAPHGPWGGGSLTSGSADVVIEGAAASSVGDAGTPHPHLPGQEPDHSTAVSGGSGTVVINGKAAARVGDPMACGGTISGGAGTVTIGG
jgi:uncharacterized Zn-binding protein involved in type VI secretion